MSEIKLPLAVSLAAHPIGVAAIFLLPATVPSAPKPLPASGIEVALTTSLPPAEPAPAVVPPAKTEAPPLASPEPEPAPPEPSQAVAAPEPPPPPQEPTQPPLPPRKPSLRPGPRHPEPPRPSSAPAPPQAPPAAIAAPQTAYVLPPASAPAPSHEIAPGYRSQLNAWLENHKRYPDAARQRGEEGHAVLRFVVDRNGRVVDFTLIKSSGFPDLDGAVQEMMRGAALPPFPAGMTQARIEVSVTVRFSLAR